MTVFVNAGFPVFYRNTSDALRFFSANLSKCSFSEVFFSSTGIGALYYLGKDFAGLGLAQRTIDALREEDEHLDDFQKRIASAGVDLCESSSVGVRWSLLAKVCYVAGMALAIAGSYWSIPGLAPTGLACMGISAVGLLVKAGFDSIDQSVEKSAAQLADTCDRKYAEQAW